MTQKEKFKNRFLFYAQPKRYIFFDSPGMHVHPPFIGKIDKFLARISDPTHVLICPCYESNVIAKYEITKYGSHFLTKLAPVMGFSCESLHRFWVTIFGQRSHIPT